MNVQHPKGFAFIFIQVFMVHFVGPPDSTYIRIVSSRKPFEALMNDYIMDNKICKPIRHYSEAHSLHPINGIDGAKENAAKAGYGKNDEEGVVLFKKTRFFLMMVFMQVP
jgi:hypothetical protein